MKAMAVADPNEKNNRRWRLALVAPQEFSLPPREGFATAVEFLIQELSEVLALRHDTTIYSLAEPSLSDSNVGGISYRYTPITRLDTLALPLLYRVGRRALRRDLNYWQSVGYFGPYAARVALKIRRAGFDVVHLFNILQFAPWIRWLAPRSKIIFHITWHGLSKDDGYFGYSTLQTELAERCLKDVDAVIACSDYLLDGIRGRFPDHAHKLHRVYNGAKPVGPLDDSAIEKPSQDLTVIFGGRIVPEKGLHTLLKAMRLVIDRVPRARLHVVGISWRPGSDFSEYRRELDRLMEGLEQHIDFLGWKSRVEFPRVLANADVYAFPSIWEEPFSMSLLEAMSAGLPVVATATGGTPELIRDGVNGFLVPPEDHVALAERISMLLTGPDLRREMGGRGQRLVRERFCWERVVDELDAVYGQVLEPRFGAAAEQPLAVRRGGV
ncbi:MAG: glycosyltransferase family 4 protein [Chloroflexi bacterium]|nr:glycosyltransferase family 4 protein [Chloroflexota bacterium]